ncbi:hypothetical protein BB559_005920 [Furculomyces boomerangus]|uniref:AP complex subunit sigma n=2 Tax=Furculomyces boomerangus TaxID=61424 RepID=A0A2T9Y5U2_9FUNG|nr:hypothetical protein BB559_005920 [Furculomyces boomerangus]
MIKSVLIFNNFGKPRLLRFFEQLDSNSQQNVLRETFMLISKRSSSNCNFLEGSKQIKNQDLKIIYRQYATLYFVFVVDKSESELGTLDLIHLFVETLNRVFDDVCELDLIFHYNEINYVLSEIVMGGMVVETGIDQIILAVKESKKRISPDSKTF